jgi:hypothetical protein
VFVIRAYIDFLISTFLSNSHSKFPTISTIFFNSQLHLTILFCLVPNNSTKFEIRSQVISGNHWRAHRGMDGRIHIKPNEGYHIIPRHLVWRAHFPKSLPLSHFPQTVPTLPFIRSFVFADIFYINIYL